MSKPSEALHQAVETSKTLLEKLDQEINKDLADEFNLEQLTDTELAPPFTEIEKLQAQRDQLVNQVFSESWTEEAVQEHLQAFQQLEDLDTQLQNSAATLRTNLHQLRTDNQQGRKAVNAYGTTKGQFSR